MWPAGLASNGKGTVDWAGGLVDWNSQDIQSNGYYYAAFESVTMSCYNGTSSPGTNKGASYTYNGYSGTNDTVVDGSNPTVLGSFLATGTNMTFGAAASSGTSTGSTPSTTAETVPGLSGGDPAGVNAHSSGVADSASTSTIAAGGSQASGSSPSSSSSSSSSSSDGGFDQGTSSSSGSKSGAEKLGAGQEQLKGSIFAGLVALIAMMAL